MDNFISLESIRIATPCRADWNQMTGDDQSRFCASCAKNVYNFSSMTRAQAEQLILEKEGHLCVRLHRRADGTVITSDCTVGISPVKRSAGALRGLLASALAAILYCFGLQVANAKVNAQSSMGDVDVAVAGEISVASTMGAPSVPPLMGKPVMQPKPTTKPKVKSGVKSHHPKRVSAKKSHR